MIKQIQKVTKSDIKQNPVPTVDQINNKKFEDMADEIQKTIESGELGKFLPSAINLVENHDPVAVIAGLMKIKFDNEQIFEYTSNSLETPKSEDVRLFFSVGKKDGLTPKILINYIKDKTRVNASTIGQIDLMENFSFVSVDRSISEKILNKCPGGKINRKKVNVEVANRRRK